MSQRNPSQRLWRLLVFSLAAALLALLPASRRSYGANARASGRTRRRPPRRFAATLGLATLFFAGAALSAGAGDQIASFVEEETTACMAEAVATHGEASIGEPCVSESIETTASAEATPAPAVPEAPAPEAVEPEPATPAPSDGQPADSALPADEVAVEAPAADTVEPVEAAPTPAVVPAPDPAAAEEPIEPRRVKRRAVVRRPTEVERATAEVDPEVDEPGNLATIWLHRELPDPTPPSVRLSRPFARGLVSVSEARNVPWSLVLGVARSGAADEAKLPSRGRLAAVAAQLRQLDVRSSTWRAALVKRERGPEERQTLADAWNAALAVTGRTDDADRAVALAHYYRAVGLSALVRGLRAKEKAIARRVLADDRIDIYAGGRDDVAAGRIDVRVTALLAYLADTFGQVTVSSLQSGHRLYARPGVISAHTYGHAVDVAALAETSIVGNQDPGGLTEDAVRAVLLLPAEMLPRQVISLLGLGGPSFPMGDHGDHIHIGF